jgi:hypothetical protein
MRFLVLRYLAGAAALFAAGLTQSLAQALAQDSANGPVVVELFTSQACSKCRAADEFFSELASRDDVIAISWHVDYWNKLETRNGRWRDPFSDPQCTKRQRQYNKNLRGRGSVYTPQMVVNGMAEAVGSDHEDVGALISAARAGHPAAAISARRDGGKLVFDIGAMPVGGEAFLVTLKPTVNTEINYGENAGMVIQEINVATELQSLGDVASEGARLTAQAPQAGDHCAILVHEPSQGRIIAAAYCPS